MRPFKSLPFGLHSCALLRGVRHFRVPVSVDSLRIYENYGTIYHQCDATLLASLLDEDTLLFFFIIHLMFCILVTVHSLVAVR